MGFVAPMIVGFMINDHNDVAHWKSVFWLATEIYTFGSLIFILLGTSVEQKWNRVSTPQVV